MERDLKVASGGPASRSSGALVRIAATTSAMLTALAGDYGTAGVCLAAVEPLGMVADRVSEAVSNARADRVARSAKRVRERLVVEQVETSSEVVEDTLLAALGPLGDAETVEKRQLIEEVIFESARRGTRTAQVEAQRAIRLIASMTSEAALIYGVLAAAYTRASDQETAQITYNEIQTAAGLPYFLMKDGLEALAKSTALVRLEWEPYDVGEDEPEYEIEWAELTYVGRWLAAWVAANPASYGVPTCSEVSSVDGCAASSS